MKIDMHLFCLVVALAASVTNGRISSSSSSQPVVSGSAVEVTLNRRDLQPALGTHYCTVTDVGQQRGVVDWQGIDQCHKCEAGHSYWPCDDDNLCTGFCTPEAVCEERLRAAADAAAAETPAASDCATACTAELEEAEKLFIQKQNVLDTNTMMVIESSNAENALYLEQLASLRAEVFKNLAEKDAEIELLLTTNEALEARLASTTSPSTSPTNLPNTKSPTKSPTNSLLIIAKKDEEFENPEEDEQNDSAYTNFFDNINQLRIDSAVPLTSTFNNRDQLVVDTAVPLTSTGKCSDGGSAGGDCSQNPTYCSSVGILDDMKASLSNEIERIESDIKIIESEKAYVEQLQGEGPDSDNNIVRCSSRGGYGGYGSHPGQDSNVLLGGGCSGTNSCLNLDFVCSPSADCEISCTGGNSCNGLTLYCAENQNCAITTCGDRTERCFGAEVVYVPTDCSVNDATFTYNEYTWQKGIGVCNL